MVKDAKPWHKFCTGYSPLARSHDNGDCSKHMWLLGVKNLGMKTLTV